MVICLVIGVVFGWFLNPILEEYYLSEDKRKRRNWMYR